jgi:uncharacterized protein (UPF0218 family)
MRRRVAAVALALGVGVAAGCVAASPDDDTYRDSAASTLGTALGDVATTHMLLTLVDHGRIPRTAVVTQMRDSEESLARTAQGFESLNPPPAGLELSEDVIGALDDAAEALRQARVAVHGEDTDSYAPTTDDLAAESSRLRDLMETVS